MRKTLVKIAFIGVFSVFLIPWQASANIATTLFDGSSAGDGTVANFSVTGTTLTMQLTAPYIASVHNAYVRFPGGDLSGGCYWNSSQPCVFNTTLGIGSPFLLIADDGGAYPVTADMEIYACPGGNEVVWSADGILGCSGYTPPSSPPWSVEVSTSTASTTAELIGTVQMGFGILIVIAFIYLIAYLNNTLFKSKPWQH